MGQGPPKGMKARSGNYSLWERPPSPCHLEEATCLRQVKGEMNGISRRVNRDLSGCPMFAVYKESCLFIRTEAHPDILPRCIGQTSVCALP